MSNTLIAQLFNTQLRTVMRKYPIFALFLVTCAIIIAIVQDPNLTSKNPEEDLATTNTSEQSRTIAPQTEKELATVIRVVDGDTIVARINDKQQTIRIANIDAPESVDPRRPVGCMGEEASEYLKTLATNQNIQLSIDISQASQDRYQRLIRFVFLEDGTDLGKKLIAEGYAYSSPYGSSPHKYLEEYMKTEQTARAAERGLWNKQTCPDQLKK